MRSKHACGHIEYPYASLKLSRKVIPKFSKRMAAVFRKIDNAYCPNMIRYVGRDMTSCLQVF